ncbi:MAG: tRNA (N6-isopentenyl adenosine(37)-C2)-methylthiotransferase MiaB [Deltaproteobacteria bacterium]|nr:tRNA (N6-isopentenyl adenosine(37)-C2)-methylthiotransferase MiaB [Deltaproteobacteria bacterium]
MVKKFYIHTFGCQMNVHDSGKIAGMLADMGYMPADADSDADFILFNTCTVRDHAHHKAISEIGRAVARKKQKKELIVGVCGCVAQAEKDHLFEIYPELDLVFGPDQISRLPDLLKGTGKNLATELIDDPADYNWLKNTIALSHYRTIARVSSFVTIMKGCNNNCSFCIVPSVRGRELSKPADDIISEIKHLTASGIKEVTLLGQNVNSYNKDFVKLVQRISNETDICRIRYTSPHPKDLSADLMEEHATNLKLCSHMHLPLQAGSDRILRTMKRSYNKDQFVKKASALRKCAEGIDITTDIIVGFPGETESDFQDTLEVVKEIAFDGMFAFKYSPRPGTKAAAMKDDVPQKEKEARLQKLLELNSKIWKEKAQRLVGTMQQVLVEGMSKRQPTHQRTNVLTHQLAGKTFGNKIVNFSGNLNLIGHIVPVGITGAGPNSLKGDLCMLK